MSKYFSDITQTWQVEAVDALYEKGIIAHSKTFRPDDNITRAEMAALINRAIQYLQNNK